MKGISILTINHETLIEALQMYFETEFLKEIRVIDFKLDEDRYADTGTYKISIQSVDHIEEVMGS